LNDKVVGYVRVSTKGQVNEGYSVTYQMEEIKRYCTRHHLELVNIYMDEGISGAKVDEEGLSVERDGLQEMLSDLRAHQVKGVVVLNTSRLWRSDMVKVLIHRELKRQEVDIYSIEQTNYSIYSHDPNDFLIHGMMELLDQYQRLEIALKLGRGRKQKAQKGGYAGGRVAYGYTTRKGQKQLVVDQQQAKVITRLFALKDLYPSWSLSQFAHQLNKEGYTTKMDKPFTKVQVKRMFDREDFYKGVYQYGDIQSTGVHQPII